MKVTLQPSGHVIDLLPGERIIDAARRLGYDAPQSCRNGNCHICAANLISGQVRQRDQLLRSGELFTCVAEPLEDCELHWEGVLAPDELPLRRLACQLDSAEPLGADVWRLRLRTPAGKPLRYHAGQYLLLQRNSEEMSAFSIASAPHQQRLLELHIQTRDPATRDLVEQIIRQRLARIQAPFGDCHLAQLPEQPLLLLAAGTGMAQMQALINHCLAQGFDKPLHLYWGVRKAADFYRIDDWQRWEDAGVQLHRVVSDQPDWPGRQGLLANAALADLGSLAGHAVIACGSPPMVYGTLDRLLQAGMQREQMRSDVFSYAPRD